MIFLSHSVCRRGSVGQCLSHLVECTGLILGLDKTLLLVYFFFIYGKKEEQILSIVILCCQTWHLVMR